jgi:hypothetical protein
MDYFHGALLVLIFIAAVWIFNLRKDNKQLAIDIENLEEERRVANMLLRH